jgi:hypothetical protein
MEAYFHTFLNWALDIYEWLASRPSCFTPGRNSPPPRYLLDRRLGGPQSRSRRCRQDKYFLSPLRIDPRFFDRRAHSLFTAPPELSPTSTYTNILLVVQNAVMVFGKSFLDAHPECFFKVQWLLYLPPALTHQNPAFCPHSVSVCSLWFSQ